MRIIILRYNVPKPSEICMSVEKLQKFFDFVMGDDLDFYEEFIIHLTDEEQESFFRDNPDFMLEVGRRCDKIYPLRDRIFRRILRRISAYEGGKGYGILFFERMERA